MANHLPYKEFLRFPETTVELVPYRDEMRAIAKSASSEVREVLAFSGKEPYFYGSAALGLAGKDEVELAVFVSREELEGIVKALTARYGAPVSRSGGRVRFEYSVGSTEVEIVVCNESECELTLAKMEYLKNHSKKMLEYEVLKYRFAYSKRDYLYHKNEFFACITDELLGRTAQP